MVGDVRERRKNKEFEYEAKKRYETYKIFNKYFFKKFLHTLKTRNLFFAENKIFGY